MIRVELYYRVHPASLKIPHNMQVRYSLRGSGEDRSGDIPKPEADARLHPLQVFSLDGNDQQLLEEGGSRFAFNEFGCR